MPALAQVTNSVTTAPIGQPAPTLALPMLVALAIALIGLGVYRMRTRSAGVLVGFVLVAALSVLAGLTYAGVSGVVIKGDDCNVRTAHTYDNENPTLTSLCPNAIQIVEIDPCSGTPSDVPGAAALPSCTVGQTLLNGDTCRLPICV